MGVGWTRPCGAGHGERTITTCLLITNPTQPGGSLCLVIDLVDPGLKSWQHADRSEPNRYYPPTKTQSHTAPPGITGQKGKGAEPVADVDQLCGIRIFLVSK